ncbi:hypothetical protein MTO96_022441 [Rhipicephalus appendiculatus]
MDSTRKLSRIRRNEQSCVLLVEAHNKIVLKLEDFPSDLIICCMKTASGSTEECGYNNVGPLRQPSLGLLVPLLLTLLSFLPASNLFVTVGFVVAERVLCIPRLWPDHASAHNNLGTVLTSGEESERHFRIALHVNPHHPGAHFNLANIYSKQGQKDVARTLMERAVELDPDFCEAYSSLAALAAGDGDLAEAERLHQMALGSDDRNADARNNYGTFLQSLGRTEEAVTQYQQALNIQQNHTVALLNAARSLRSMNLNMQAESLYKRALALEPDPLVMDNLAVFYVSAGRMDEARQLFEEICRLFPGHHDSKVHHSYEVAIRLDPDLAHAHLNLAVIRHLEVNTAVASFSKAFRLSV